MNFSKTNARAYTNFILGRYARLTGMTNSTALPVYLFADPSSACNLRCAMCMDDGNVSRRKRPQVIMDQDIFDALLTDVGETLFMISLYNWGEPLLNPNLPRFISKAKGFDIYVDINTNLSLNIHDSEMEGLLASGPDSIVVSLDGFSEQTYQTYRQGGNFDLVKNNIVRMATMRDRLGLSTEIVWKFLVFSFNEHEVEHAERFCAAKGITFSRKEAIIDINSRPEWLPSYRRSEVNLKHGGWPFRRRSDPSLMRAGMGETCIWHYSLAAVNSDGSLSPCCAVAEKIHDFGAIIPGKASFTGNWNNQLYRSARNILAGRNIPADATAVPLCLNCPYPFLKDFTGGLDVMICGDFKAKFPFPDPLLAEAFRLFDSGKEFIAFVERNYDQLCDSSLSLVRRGVPHLGTSMPVGIPAGSGICSICGNRVEFRLKQKGFSLRETVCPCCGGSRRSRDLAAVVLETFGGAADTSLASHVNLLNELAIFEAQATGPVHDQLKRLPGYICAEFLDGVPSGTKSQGGIRCENLEELTFPNESFDLIITQDVFEHVANPQAAFREIARVLKPGGCHIFTVPLHEGNSTVTRVELINGQPAHLLPPVYHGDPLRSSGSLVYTDFGDDLTSLLSEYGFTTESLRQGIFYTPEEIPTLVSGGEHDRYEELRKRGEHLKLFLYNSVVFRAKRPALSKSQNERIESMEHQPDGGAFPRPLHQMLYELLEVVRHEPVSAAGLVKIGESCFRNDLTTSAAGFFQAALIRDPRCSEAMNNMGVMAFTSADYKNAESHFIDALETAPDFREARQNLAQLYNEAPQLADRQRENAVHCPCCCGFFPGFIAGGPSLRPKACCPRCGSLERHRLLWLYLQEKTDFFTKRLRVLHVAPEPVFQEQFRKLPNLDYISADIASPLAMVKMDITDIQFPDNTFDVILCSHVLEHVPDDRRAMVEILRVLKPGGWAILQVPIDMNRVETFEDHSVAAPAERQRLFGQEDHVRWYGKDYPERLKEAGFIVNVDDYANNLDKNITRKLGIVRTESIFFCSAPNSGHENRYVVPRSDSLNSIIISAASDYNIVPIIHNNDFSLDFLLSRMPDERTAVNQYFKSGDYSATKLSELIADIHGLPNVKLNLLEFAAGYGSITRHLSNHLPDNVIVTCCDIHADAVNFIQDQFGYSTIISAAIPEHFNIGTKYDVVFALSFFSYIHEKTWARWLRVLLDKLAEGGRLIFTTHGFSSLLRANYPLDLFTGFIYREESEQKGLDVEEYGHTIVSPQFVSSCVPTGYHIISFREAEWEEHQDLFIIAKN